VIPNRNLGNALRTNAKIPTFGLEDIVAESTKAWTRALILEFFAMHKPSALEMQ
jgi:hypothetical protein